MSPTPQAASAAEDAAAQLLSSQESKPTLHEIDPGGAGGREMKFEAGTFEQPSLNGSCLMRAIVVKNEMNIKLGRHFGIDLIEELAELQRTVPAMKLTDDLPSLSVRRDSTLASRRESLGIHFTYATMLIANGENVKVVQELMHHANSRCTLDVYTQARISAKREAQQRIVQMILPQEGLASEVMLRRRGPTSAWEAPSESKSNKFRVVNGSFWINEKCGFAS